MPPDRTDSRARMGAVELTVSDIDRSVDFYEQVIGLAVLGGEGGGSGGEGGPVAMGAAGGDEPLVVLHGDPAAPPRPARSTGLFHMAFLLPRRLDLAHALLRLAERGWPLTGASDHLVSEALYLSDPDGIGIEIYRDRPREEWSVDGGEVRMATLPLDLDDVARAAQGPAPPRAPEQTRMGHVHLNVSDLGTAEAFYAGELGFDVTARNYPGALFLAAGGYHHHIGANTWRGEGAPPPPPGAIGLRRFTIVAPGQSQAEAADPSGNALVIRGASDPRGGLA